MNLVEAYKQRRILFGFANRMKILVCSVLFHFAFANADRSIYMKMKLNSGVNIALSPMQELHSASALECGILCASNLCCFTAVFKKNDSICNLYDIHLRMFRTTQEASVFIYPPWETC